MVGQRAMVLYVYYITSFEDLLWLLYLTQNVVHVNLCKWIFEIRPNVQSQFALVNYINNIRNNIYTFFFIGRHFSKQWSDHNDDHAPHGTSI